MSLPWWAILSCSVVSDSLWPHGFHPPGSSVHGVSQARTLQWVAISSSREPSPPRNQIRISWISCIWILYHWATWEDPCCCCCKSLRLCPTLCDPIDGSPPGSPVPGILQARTLEWVAISFSNAWKWRVKVKSLKSCLTLSNPMDCSLPGSSVHGIFQARGLEWSAIA